MKKILIYGLAAVLALAAFSVTVTYRKPVTWQSVLGPSALQFVDESKPLEEQTVRVEIAGRVFQVPLMYVDSQVSPDGVYRDDILLEVFWPDMRSIHQINSRAEYERLANEERRIGWILLEDSAKRPSLDEQVSIIKNSMTKTEEIENYNNLHRTLLYQGMPDKLELQSAMYVKKDNSGHVTDRINCSRTGKPVYAVCEHKFVDGGVVYQISYNEKRFIHEWNQQRIRAIQFVRNFEGK